MASPALKIDDLKAYLRWMFIYSVQDALPSWYFTTVFNFYGPKVLGKSEPKPKWKRCLIDTEDSLSDAVGDGYAKRYFSTPSKTMAKNIFGSIKAELRESLVNEDWIDDQTKNEAIRKLEKIKSKIGYPDKYRQYGNVALTESNYLENFLKMKKINKLYVLSKIEKPTHGLSASANDDARIVIRGQICPTAKTHLHQILTKIFFDGVEEGV